MFELIIGGLVCWGFVKFMNYLYRAYDRSPTMRTIVNSIAGIVVIHEINKITRRQRDKKD